MIAAHFLLAQQATTWKRRYGKARAVDAAAAPDDVPGSVPFLTNRAIVTDAPAPPALLGVRRPMAGTDPAPLGAGERVLAEDFGPIGPGGVEISANGRTVVCAPTPQAGDRGPGDPQSPALFGSRAWRLLPSVPEEECVPWHGRRLERNRPQHAVMSSHLGNATAGSACYLSALGDSCVPVTKGNRLSSTPCLGWSGPRKAEMPKVA